MPLTIWYLDNSLSVFNLWYAFVLESFRQDCLVEGHPESKLCQKFGGGLEGFPDLFVVNLYKS